MHTGWFKNKTTEQKEEIKGRFKRARLLRKDLSEIVRDRMKALSTMETSATQYDNPNWQLIVADQRGCLRTYKEILALIEEK